MVSSKKNQGEVYEGKEKEKNIFITNILAARGVSDFIRTSLGPRGMDKMITTGNDDVIISNDGATILKNLDCFHPIARMLVELSNSQDAEVGDGTTSVVIIAGALLEKSKTLIEKGIHPNVISEHYKNCAKWAAEIIKGMSRPVSIDSDEKIVEVAITSLSSKIVSSESSVLAPIAVKAVKSVIDPSFSKTDVDLNDIRVITKLGGTIEDSSLVDGVVFSQKATHSAGGPTKIKNAKIGLIQFQLSSPKTYMDFNISVNNRQQIEQLQKEERLYIIKMMQKILKTGCNVLLVQKSIVRDAVTTLSLHFLAKKNIMVLTDIERSEVEFLSKSLGCKPISAIEEFTADKLGSAELMEETKTADGTLVFARGVKSPGKTVSVLVRGSSELVLRETERSLHDALCVVRCLVRNPSTVPGGAAAEMEVSTQIRQRALQLDGAEAMCVTAFADALETIPFTLAENCGLNPIKMVTELRDAHARGETKMGINVRRGRITDLEKESIIQPSLVTLKAVALATECVQMILKIDGIIQTARD